MPDTLHTPEPVYAPVTIPDGPWLDRPEDEFRAMLADPAMTDELRADAGHFRTHGWLVKDFGLPAEDLDAAAAFTREMSARKVRIQDAWMISNPVRRLATHPAVLRYLGELYRRETFPFQTLNFVRGSQQDAHADSFFFSSRPDGFMCGVWIALEDIHPDSGPLVYFSGSHRFPPPFEGFGYDPSRAAQLVEAMRRSGIEPQAATIRKGQAFVWAASLVHGGSAIADPARTRLSQVTHYYFRGCSYLSPLGSADGEGIFWREPYDIARRRFVGNAGRGQAPRLRYRLGQRLRLWARRPYME